MKILFYLCFVSILICQGYGTIEVNVFGFENREGKLRVALVNTEETFLSENPFMVKELEISGDTVSFTFDSLKFDYYALQIYHDEDDNKELNTNFLGVPTENYGFSNNARSAFGPPNFEDARFKHNKLSTKLSININP